MKTLGGDKADCETRRCQGRKGICFIERKEGAFAADGGHSQLGRVVDDGLEREEPVAGAIRDQARDDAGLSGALPEGRLRRR